MSSDQRGRPALTVQMVIGLCAILYGLLLTADNLGWIHAQNVLHYWPVAIVLIGATMFTRARDGAGRVSAGTVMFIGAWLTAARWFGWSVSLGMIWPIILIVVGVVILTRGRDVMTVNADGAISEHKFTDLAFLAGVKRRITTPMFKRADFTAFMGGVDLDLRSAGLAGGEAVIDVFIVMGGMEIKVPPDWAVSNEAVAVMAGVDDRSTGTRDAPNRLILRGFVFMGGVEIKS